MLGMSVFIVQGDLDIFVSYSKQLTENIGNEIYIEDIRNEEKFDGNVTGAIVDWTYHYV